MSASNVDVPGGPTAAQQPPEQPAGNVIFVIPPPPTVWIHFNNGTPMAFTPSPARYLQFVLGRAPLFDVTPGSSEANRNGSEIFASALNELFQRAQAQHHGPPPTSKSFLEKLPVKSWTQDMEKTELHSECVICLSNYEEGDQVLSLPCGHTFHKDCSMTWLVEHNLCPTCRYELPTLATKPCAPPTTAQATPVGVPTTVSPIVEPEHEPTLAENAHVTGIRRSRSTESFRPRDVRQRVDEPAESLNVAELDEEAVLDDILEEEADRFVREEMAKRQIASDDQDAAIDRDVEEFIHESSGERWP